jgi:hypothetical protein
MSAQFTPGHAQSNYQGRDEDASAGTPVMQPYCPMSSKERSALRQRRTADIVVVISPEDGGEEVMQHSDGGRVVVPVTANPPREVPPSYTSISGSTT